MANLSFHPFYFKAADSQVEKGWRTFLRLCSSAERWTRHPIISSLHLPRFPWPTASPPPGAQYLRRDLSVCKGPMEIWNDQSWMYQVRQDFWEKLSLVLDLTGRESTAEMDEWKKTFFTLQVKWKAWGWSCARGEGPCKMERKVLKTGREGRREGEEEGGTKGEKLVMLNSWGKAISKKTRGFPEAKLTECSRQRYCGEQARRKKKPSAGALQGEGLNPEEAHLPHPHMATAIVTTHILNGVTFRKNTLWTFSQFVKWLPFKNKTLSNICVWIHLFPWKAHVKRAFDSNFPTFLNIQVP